MSIQYTALGFEPTTYLYVNFCDGKTNKIFIKIILYKYIKRKTIQLFPHLNILNIFFFRLSLFLLRI